MPTRNTRSRRRVRKRRPSTKTSRRKKGRRPSSQRSQKPSIMPTFTPNVKPRMVFKKGAFGGTYFRIIESDVVGTKILAKHSIKEFEDKGWWKGIDTDKMVTSSVYRKDVNKYGVKVGSSLEDWESKNWIFKYDPYGWFQWYCRYSLGRRITKEIEYKKNKFMPYDEWQIGRWNKITGPNGRFRRMLMNMIIKKNSTFDDISISPKIRQVLLHWGYELTEKDFNEYKRSIK